MNFFLFALIISVFALFPYTNAQMVKSIAVLRGDSPVTGTVTLTQNEGENTSIYVSLKGLTPGPHGFHIQ